MSLIYLYGFVPEGTGLPERGLLGLGDSPVELIAGPGFGAAIGGVPEEEYGEAAVEVRGGDVEWMAEQGLRHEQVVAWFVDHASILPSRLLTLFRSEDALRTVMDREADRILSDLERFEGRREWNIKVFYEPAPLLEHLAELSEEIARLDEEIARAGPGKRFLLEKKRKDLAATESRAAARGLASKLLQGLRARAEDTATLATPSEGAPVVLNAALLVPSEREAELRDYVEAEERRLRTFGMTVEFTGPWAPYRFLGEAE